jgi:hypothetical protein
MIKPKIMCSAPVLRRRAPLHANRGRYARNRRAPQCGRADLNGGADAPPKRRAPAIARVDRHVAQNRRTRVN